VPEPGGVRQTTDVWLLAPHTQLMPDIVTAALVPKLLPVIVTEVDPSVPPTAGEMLDTIGALYENKI